MKKFWAFIVFGLLCAAMAAAQVPASNHVVLVVEENQSYSSVIGSSAMPYLNSLANKYGLATQYYANTHSTIGNSFEMTTGQVLTRWDGYTPSSYPVSVDNIARQLMVAGKTWKSYAEGLPSVGYTGGDTGAYLSERNPFAYFTDVQNSSVQKMNLVPFSQFATDLANGQLPNFSYVVPNVYNDGNKGTLQQADAWLKQNIEPLLANAAFQQDGLLIITFDEAASTDTTNGGGRVATLVIGPMVKPGYKSTTVYQHQSLLKTVLKALGVTTFPGASATASTMGEFFGSSTSTQPGVTISSPAAGATVSSPVNFVASATSGTTNPITAMRIYVDNQNMYTVGASKLNTSLTLAAGAHNVTIVAWDSTGKSYTKSESITVGTATVGSVTIQSPVNGSTVSSPVQMRATATADSGSTITAMRVYVDNVSAYSVSGATVNTSLSMGNGAHYVVVQAWDNTGKVYKASENITVSAPTAGTLAVSPTALSFGSVNVGSSASKSVTLTAGSSAVTVSQANVSGAGFSVSGLTLPVTIAAGQSVAMSVRFAPTAAGSVSGALSLVSNASTSTSTVALSGTGSAVAGTLSVSPTSLSFGSVTVGSSLSKTVTLTAGGAAVTVSQANVSGAGLSVSGLTLPATIAAGQSVSMTVKYAPTAAGSVAGTLALVSNASNAVSVSLSGTGTAVTPVAHSVTVKWTASVSSGVAGYNVYRGTQAGGPYTKLTATKVTGTSYTDSSVTSGTTYYYVVTAVNSSGMESANSSSATAVVPNP